MDYDIIVRRSSRRTLALEITPQCQVLVRAPLLATDREINTFVAAHKNWISTAIARTMARQSQLSAVVPLTQQELDDLRSRAQEYIPQRVAHFAPIVGADYGRITIRCQHTRWGSCSSQGNLNFNCLLMLAPSQVLDYVVVHELCHRLEMNHSPRFYAHIQRVLPDYKEQNMWLRTNGAQLLARAKR